MANLSGNTTMGGHKVFHKGNMGSGSLADGDTVDGLHFRVNAGKLEFSTDCSTWSLAGTNTADGTATAAQILSGQTAYVNDVKLTGTMANNGAWNATPGASAITIPAGYHNGSGTVAAVAVPAANVLTGTTIAGTAGTMANRGAVTSTIATHAGTYTIPAGYHNGSGVITASYTNFAANVIKSGTVVGGVTGSYDTEATNPIAVGTVLSGKVGFVNGAKITGTMANNGATGGTLSTNGATYSIPAGYTTGGTVTASITNLSATNVKHAVVVGGVTGSYDTEATNPIAASTVLTGKIGFVNGAKITGTMTNYSNNVALPATVFEASSGCLDVSLGFTGYVTTNTRVDINDNNFISENIKNGVSVLGCLGSLAPRNYASGTATSSSSVENMTSDSGGTLTLAYISVSGLTFSPTVIVVTNIVSTNYAPTIFSGNGGLRQGSVSRAYIVCSYNFLPSGQTYACVYSNSFTLPVTNTNTQYNWYAFA